MPLLNYVTHVPPEKILPDYQAGNIGSPDPGHPDHWCMACPLCSSKFSLDTHTVIKHLDGTLSVMPSLVCAGSERLPCKAHYFVNYDAIFWIS